MVSIGVPHGNPISRGWPDEPVVDPIRLAGVAPAVKVHCRNEGFVEADNTVGCGEAADEQPPDPLGRPDPDTQWDPRRLGLGSVLGAGISIGSDDDRLQIQLRRTVGVVDLRDRQGGRTHHRVWTLLAGFSPSIGR